MRRLNRMAAEVPPEAPWRAPKRRGLGLPDLRVLDAPQRPHRVARDILRLAIIGVWAAEPRDVSLLHVLFYIRSAGSMEILTDAEGGAQQDRMVGGTQLISLRMAEELGPTAVELLDAGARDPPLRGRSHRGLRPGHGERQAGDRRRAADPCRADRLRPAAAGGSRRALAADGAGQRGQVHGGLRAAVLARARASRAPSPASPARSRSASTTPRPRAHRECCSGSSRAAPRARPWT